MKKLLLLLLCAIFCLTCVSCSGDDKEGAEVAVYLSTPIYNFDPAYAYTDEATAQVLKLLYTPLLTLDDDGDVQEGLAEDWEIISDPEEKEFAIEFTLQEYAYWSNGAKITSTDFVYAWTRLLDPLFTSDAASLLFDIKNARAYKNCQISSQFDVGIIPLETDVLRVEFEEEIDYDKFLVNCTSLALAPVYEDNAASFADWATNVALINTCGPFAVRTFKPNEKLVLERNTYYMRDEHDAIDKFVTPKSLIIDMTMTPSQQVQAFNDNKLFFVGYVPLENRATYQDSEYLKTFDSLTTHTYYFNTERAPFDDANVRKALSMAISRNDIAKQLVFAKPAQGFVPESAWDIKEKASFRENSNVQISGDQSLAAAQSLIAAANLTAQEKRIELTIRPNEIDRAVANAVKTAWEQLGFSVSILELNVSEYSNVASGYDFLLDDFRIALYKGDFDVIAVDATMLTPDPLSLLATYSSEFSGSKTSDVSKPYDGTHLTGYHSLAYDGLMEQAFRADNAQLKSILLHRAEAMLIEDMPAMPIFVYQNAYLIHDDIKKVKFDYAGNYDLQKMKLKNYEDYMEEK